MLVEDRKEVNKQTKKKPFTCRRENIQKRKYMYLLFCQIKFFVYVCIIRQIYFVFSEVSVAIYHFSLFLLFIFPISA